ncbi:MAG: hypothetical protein ISQ23_00985 [Alphaproteobacteria bacterium]|nr:hypothetical protein [Alphaproteobacteria bacterium]MBL6776061.1 hypothetical protein [Alphaproteobacteria bacterium]
MTHKLFRFSKSLPIVLLVALLGLSSCATSTKQTILPEYETAGFQSLRLDARVLNISEEWVMPMEPPYIEHTLSPNLSSMLVDWATRVLVPVGGSGEVVLNITQASVKMTALPRSERLVDLFSDKQEFMVRADIKAKLLWIQPVGGKQVIIDLSATASNTVKETATPNERDLIIREVMINTIDLIDEQAASEIKANKDLNRS